MNKFSYAILSLCLMCSTTFALAQGAMAMDDINKNTMGMKSDTGTMDKNSMAGGSMKKEAMDNGTMKRDSMSKNKMDKKAHPKKKHKPKMEGATDHDAMQRMQ